jgi:hypothetical protein
MNRQQQIDSFLLEAHKLALARLRAQPHRMQEVAALLGKWRLQAGATRSDAYWNEWDDLIAEGVDAMERAACAQDEHGAVLRSVSPLSVLVSQQERGALLRQARMPP